ncbi:MAG: hypothetical protein MSH32_01625 [Lachnospiraceae bacterium]|nr:hypothetical protein [Lachnospiraceae bacterium]
MSQSIERNHACGLTKKRVRNTGALPQYYVEDDHEAIIPKEIFRMRDQKSQAEAETRSREETRKRISELQDFIGSQQSEITEFDESLV